MRFFLGVDDIKVVSQEKGNKNEHYAWCLEQLANDFENARDNKAIKNSLHIFKENMFKTNATKLLFDNIGSFVQDHLKKDTDLDSLKDYIFDCVSRICLPEGYLSYTQ
jgi:hypothetical protein